MKRYQIVVVALATASLLVACGGGGDDDDDDNAPRASALKVVGASLADSGTLGLKVTVQSAQGQPYPVYSERVAQAYGLPALCPVYRSVDLGLFTSPQPNCTNYAVAGAAIHYGVLTDTNQDDVDDVFIPISGVPLSQLSQLKDVGERGFAPNDVLLVGEGSANDAGTLVTAYLTDVATAGGLNTTVFAQLITSLFKDGGAVAGAGVASPDRGAAAGVAYMQRLAQDLVASVRDNALNKGARRIVILNTLDITRTPRVEAILARLPSGDSASARALFQSWIQAYNAALNEAVQPWADRVAVVDFYGAFNAQLADPGQFGLTNITHTVCDETSAQASVPPYAPTLQTAGRTSLRMSEVEASCNDSYASSITPSTGGGTDWWQSYLFADSFHPTPRGHELLADVVTARLRALNWQ